MRRWTIMLAGCATLAWPSAPARAGTPFCGRPIARATWSDEALGPRLKVFPSGCGRRTAWLAPEAAFTDALAAGGRPPVNRRSLFLQFHCHAFFAPLKRSWNLEAWRPVVGPKRLVKALCNPSGRARTPQRAGLLALILRAVRSA